MVGQEQPTIYQARNAAAPGLLAQVPEDDFEDVEFARSWALGHATLTGATPLEKGTIHMMSRRAELELLDAISTYFHHATPGLGPQVELYQNAEWGMRQRDRALRAMGYFNSVLKTQPFIAGAAFSMADITVIGAFIFAAIVKLPVPAQHQALHAWHRRMLERPSVQAWQRMVEETGTAVVN